MLDLSRAPYLFLMQVGCAVRTSVLKEEDQLAANEAEQFGSKEEFEHFKTAAIADLMLHR